MSRLHRTLTLAGAATLGLSLLAGCSQSGTITISSEAPSVTADAGAPGGAPGGATLAALRSAGEATTAVTSGRYESTVADGEGDVFMTITGEFSGDRTHQSTKAATGALLGGSSADGLTTETITDGSTLYFGGSVLAEMAGLYGESESGAAGAEWYRFDAPVGSDGTGIDGAELFGGTFGQGLGRETTALLSGAYGEVTTIGPEDVRGIATTHSRVDVDLGKLVGEELDDLTDDLGAGTIPVDVWLGDDGLVHRMRFEIDAAAMGIPGAGDASMVSTFELWDVGADITIDVPENAAEFDPTTVFGGR